MSHALLSPSGASRWLVCTPSARLEEPFPDSESEAAYEGTVAHSLAETMLLYTYGVKSKAKYDDEVTTLKRDKIFTEKKSSFNEMKGHVENYVSFVMEKYALAKKRSPNPIFRVEEKVDLSAYVPGSFGTGDCIIIADGTMYFPDLKYGKGVPVDAENNRQLMLYALGFYEEFGHMYDVKEIEVSIFQPRIDNISSWTISVKDLLAWAETELKPKALLAWEGKGEFVPGEKQCRFCRARTQCKALADFNLQIAKHDFKPAELLTPEETSEILDRYSLFTKWIEGVKEYAQEQAKNGKEWPNYKLVEGRSNRKYSDEEKVRAALDQFGILEDDYTTSKLLNLTEMQGLLGKMDFDAIIGPLLIKPPGAPVLVHESDKRAALGSFAKAKEDFAEFKDNNFSI